MSSLFSRLNREVGSSRRRAALAAAGLGVAMLVAPAPDAAAITIRSDVSIATINQFGRNPRYQSVGRFYTDTNAARREVTGTGTLIDHRWVLTSAHVVDGAGVDNFTIGRDVYGIQGFVTAPRYDRDDDTFANDLALVRLNRPVLGIARADLYRTFESELSKTAMITGYGKTGTGDTGLNNITANAVRVGQNRVDGFTDNGNIILTDFNTPGGGGEQVGQVGVTRYEAGVTAGDSGGAMFVHDGQQWALAAVAAFASSLSQAQPTGRYGEINGFVRIRPQLDWIDSVLGGSYQLQPLGDSGRTFSTLLLEQGPLDPVLGNWGGSVPLRGSAVPEPAGLAALLSGSTLMLGRRRALRGGPSVEAA